MRSLAPYSGLGGQHVLQSSQALLGTVCLVEADDGIDHHDGQNDDRILDVADERGEHRRANEHKDQDALELAKNISHPERGGASGRRWVRTVLCGAVPAHV